mmetsp:Transcript_20430/g.36644  ORF Transcript_20430/g.36644 Transcript_20430/m.36644 type:complete len:217 (-) Transcript_20430:115-765(-)
MLATPQLLSGVFHRGTTPPSQAVLPHDTQRSLLSRCGVVDSQGLTASTCLFAAAGVAAVQSRRSRGAAKTARSAGVIGRDSQGRYRFTVPVIARDSQGRFRFTVDGAKPKAAGAGTKAARVPLADAALRSMLLGVSASAKGGTKSKPSAPELLDLFASIDKNGDGNISNEELREALAKANVKDLSDDKVDEMVKKADINGDGQINCAEFVRLMKNP